MNQLTMFFKVLQYVGKAMPFIVLAADVVTALTPSGIDDAVWAQIKRLYPTLLDGTEKTPEQLKTEAFIIASETMKSRYPDLDTSTARAAVQLAYLTRKPS